MSFRQAGHIGSTWSPLRSKVPREGKALWHNHHTNILILGMTSNFHIQLYFHIGWSLKRLSWASQVADFVENLPLPVCPQQKKSKTSVYKIGIP